MDPSSTLAVLGLLLALLLAVWVTAARVVLASVSRARVEQLAAEKQPRADVLLTLLENPLRTALTLSLLNSLAWIATLLFAAYVAARLDGVAVVAAMALTFVGVYVLKGVAGLGAMTRGMPLALGVASPLALVLRGTSPLLDFTDWLTHRLRGKESASNDRERISDAELQMIVAEVDEGRGFEKIEPEERAMITGVMGMGERWVSEIMIPRIDVVALDVETPLGDALDVIVQHAHSRVPVYEGDIDHVVGMVYAKDLLKIWRDHRENESLRSVLRPAYFVPESKRVDELLAELQEHRVHMAMVVDEYGGTAGIVTIEDALEEIVGEIRDEYDTKEEPWVERVNATEAIFDARMNVDKVNDELGVSLPTEESDTLGGLVYDRLEKMPKVGDTVNVADASIAVLGVVGRRIQKLRVRKLEAEHNGDDADEKQRELERRGH